MRVDRPRVLVVDDHTEQARAVVGHLAALGWDVGLVTTGADALRALASGVPDLLLTALHGAAIDGLAILDHARQTDPELPVIVLTGRDEIQPAIEAMQRGAWHYLTRPIHLDELDLHVDRAVAARQLRRDSRALRAGTREALHALVGRSPAMRRMFDLIERVAASRWPVLVRGERGSGKELVARAVHAASARRDRPFVTVDCAALPGTLLESELFGHVRGAFGGATAARPGRLVEASGGTLFLDEIGALSPALQVRLLRAVQLGEIQPVGSSGRRTVDVRLVAATHQEPDRQEPDRIETDAVRADLHDRLDVVPIVIPPLRERPEDVPLLIEHFLTRSCARNPHSPVRALSPALVSTLSGHAWPGNVRELENAIERLVVVGAGVTLDVADLHEIVPAFAAARRFEVKRDAMPSLRELEDEYIAWVVARSDGNKTRAAQVLGVDVSTIHRRTGKGREVR